MSKKMMMLVVLSFTLVSTSFVDAASTTFNWSDYSFSTPHNLYEADGTTKAALGSWQFYVYAYNGTAANVATAASSAAGPLAGSYAIDVTGYTWDANLITGDANDGKVTPSPNPFPTVDASANGIVGWTTYVLFENAADDHVGFIWSSNWTVPDDSVNVQNLSMNLSYELYNGGVDGTRATGGTIGTVNAGDGWAATNAVPEPGTMALFAIGMLTVAARRRRK